MKFTSCKNCDRRHYLCWGECPDYQAEKKKNDEERARREETRRKEEDFIGVFARRGTRR